MARESVATAFRLARLLAMVAVLVLAPLAARAQQANTAVIVGTVVDSSEAAVPGATIRLTHPETSATSELISDERGQYRTAPLRVGEYNITVELQGFKTFSQRGWC
jgi:hypothetical protein